MRNMRTRELLKLQFNKCAYCRVIMTEELGKPNTVTKDHVVPKSAMNSVRIKDSFNVVAACLKCNQAKGSQPLPLFLSTLFRCDKIG
jgi:5-methylcytosine-specific restriction endonuclease McrA